MRILRLGTYSTATPTADYLFKQKKKPLADEGNRTESPWTLKETSLGKEFITNPDKVIYTLKFLAGLPI